MYGYTKCIYCDSTNIAFIESNYCKQTCLDCGSTLI